VEEIKYIKTIIERDARQEFEALLERLRSAEGKKLAILNHDISELQKLFNR
jgi:palmitoyltransferase